MNFPIYKELDIGSGSDDDEMREFKEFISQVHEQDTWERPAEKGIVALINSKGTEGLSVRQTKVLAIILSRYQGAECKVCEK